MTFCSAVSRLLVESELVVAVDVEGAGVAGAAVELAAAPEMVAVGVVVPALALLVVAPSSCEEPEANELPSW